MDPIEPFEAESERTLLSAREANKLVRLANMLAGIRPGPGIKISIADSGIKIELSPELQRGLALDGDGTGGEGETDGQAPGPIKWRGEWSETKAYEKNDIVIRRTSADMNNGTLSGTYIAILDNTNVAPSEAVATSQATWRTFAKGSWDVLIIGDVATKNISFNSSTNLCRVIDPAGETADTDTPRLDFANNFLDMFGAGVSYYKFATVLAPSWYPSFVMANPTDAGSVTIDLAAAGAQAFSLQAVSYKDESEVTRTRRFL